MYSSIMDTRDLSDVPVEPAPPGQTSDFNDPQGRIPMGYGVVSLAFGLMLFFVSLRIYTRALVTKSFSWEDWSCIVATILTIAFNISTYLVMSTNALGPHDWDIRLIDINETYYRDFLVVTFMYPFDVMAIKVTILLLFRRIFGVKPGARVAVDIGLVLICTFYMATNLAQIGLMVTAPGKTLVEKGTTARWWVTALRVNSSMAAFGLATDLYLLCIPLPIIWRLNQPRGRKIRSSIVFVTGLLATVACALNLYYRLVAKGDGYLELNVAISNVYETNIGVVVASLPTLPPLAHDPNLQKLTSLASSSRNQLTNLKKHLQPSVSSAQSERLGGDSDVDVPMQALKDGDSGFRRIDSFPSDRHVVRLEDTGKVHAVREVV